MLKCLLQKVLGSSFSLKIKTGKEKICDYVRHAEPLHSLLAIQNSPDELKRTTFTGWLSIEI
jgi:hypothetical protein